MDAPLQVKASTIKAVILEGDKCHATSSVDELAAAHAAGKNFWVELDEEGPEADRLLGDILKIHPLAIEDIGRTSGSRRSRTSATTSSS